ncbi:MAG: glycosyl hydrolase [Gammaproteobacteria bacterium]
MKRSLPLIIAAGAGSLYFVAAFDLARFEPQLGATTEANTTAAKHSKGSPMEPGDWLLQRRLSGDPITETQLARATRARASLRAQRDVRARALAGDVWRFRGPDNIGGRILDLALDPLDANVVYAATASGGVMKSTDAGNTLASVWPAQNAQAIGALAMSPSGKLYAGVGEGGPNGSSPTLGNKGVFVSSDGAQTWQSLGLELSARIGRIAIDPTNENRLYVAATGPVFATGGQRGVYRSDDAGANWSLVLAGLNDTTGAADILIDPINPNRLYAVMWDHLRQASFRRLGGEGSGVFRSDDGGDSWTRLAGGLPAAGPDVGRIGLALAPSDPTRLYSIVIDRLGFFASFHRSNDGGTTWNTLPASSTLVNSQSSFGWWFGRLWVDPVNTDRVLVAGVPLLQSMNAGATFAQVAGFHVDQHALVFDPAVPGRVYLGNDGGLYRSDFNGSSNSWLPASVQPYTQSYTVAVSQQDDQRLLTGTQDNRCLRSYGGPFDEVLEWNIFGCGDGLEVLIDPQDQNAIYGCSQRGFCIRSFNGGSTTTSIGTGGLGARTAWQAPLIIDPNDSQVLYFAADSVFRSTNQGSSWTSISPSLTGPDPDPNDNYTFGTITALAASASDPLTLYAGTDDARVWVTRDQGATWTQSMDLDLPDRWVTAIAIDPANANRAYVSYTGYHAGDNTPYVLVTEDGGTNFDDITSDLPQAPVNDIATGPSGELVALSDIGVYVSVDNGASWNELGDNLPTSPAMSATFHVPTRELVVATFGRGLWSATLPLTDTDDDGIADAQDNCLQDANTKQLDTDGDQIGNACDADFNNDCVVNVVDLGEFRSGFFGSDPLYDLSGDGVVNAVDLGRLRQLFFQPPGPSGLRNDCQP